MTHDTHDSRGAYSAQYYLPQAHMAYQKGAFQPGNQAPQVPMSAAGPPVTVSATSSRYYYFNPEDEHMMLRSAAGPGGQVAGHIRVSSQVPQNGFQQQYESTGSSYMPPNTKLLHGSDPSSGMGQWKQSGKQQQPQQQQGSSNSNRIGWCNQSIIIPIASRAGPTALDMCCVWGLPPRILPRILLLYEALMTGLPPLAAAAGLRAAPSAGERINGFRRGGTPISLRAQLGLNY